jgi:hypothetical protein
VTDDTITFVERHDPALPSGTYEIAVTQKLASKDGETIKPETHASKQSFAVLGPRFSLAPAEIAAQFPPPNSQGEYAKALPHIAFGRLTLPWARAAGPDPVDTSKTLPWLALLTIDDAEGVSPVAAQVGDLQRAAFAPDPKAPATTRASTLAATTASYADAGAGGKLTLEHGQALSDPCRVIDVPVGLLAAIAPSAADLHWLAHTRNLTTGGEQSELSFVVANRTPPPSGSATAHLVSLEGLSAWLPQADGTPARIVVGGVAAADVRLVSLASWTFSAIAPEETFAGLLSAVSSGILALRPPDGGTGPAADTVQRATLAGYCGLRHRTRAGDLTVSWYRGPFLPCPPSAGLVPAPDPSAPAEPVTSADQLLRYDPATGMFDASYAAAWQLGRLLAVQDLRFSAALRAWKASVSQKTALAAEAEVVRERIGAVADADASASLLGRVAGALNASTATAEPAAAPPATDSVYARHRQRVGDAKALAEQHADTSLPQDLADWLASLALLEGVPLAYLVPDERLLPAESVDGKGDTRTRSIRFFRVDPNWTTALVEGAFSIARASSAQAANDAAVAGAVAGAMPAPPASGFLLRSIVVDHWSGLQVTASDAARKPLDVVRLDRIGPGLLLCLVDGVIGQVDLHEPPGTLHLDVAAPVPRYVTVPKGVAALPGKQIGDQAISVPTRVAVGRVVKVDALANSLKTDVESAHANEDATGGRRPFTGAELALQLTAGAQAVRFEAKP